MDDKPTILVGISSLIAITLATIIFYKTLKFGKKPTPTPPLPPGPSGFPITGSLPQLFMNKPAFRWIHNLMNDLNTEIACIRLGNVHVIPVTSPELAREFLRKQDAIFASRPEVMLAKLASDDYLMVAFSPLGDQWKKMKRVFASEVLSPSMHQWLHGKRCEEADHLVRYVYNQCESPNKSGLVNVRDAARHYCGNVTRKMVYGKRFFGPGMEDGGPGLEEREHMSSVFTILSHLYGFSVSDYVPWLEIFDLDGCKNIITNANNIIRKYQDPEIINRVQMWERGIKDTKEDILDVLINLKDSKDDPLLSVREIKTLLVEIMMETTDNPSNAVEWTIAEMINQPKILARACEELDLVVGKDRLVQESNLPKLNYIKACIKESLRLHPILPFNIPHVSTKDAVVGGYFIPKGSHVLISRLGLGRNPRVWKDPLRYKPERHIVDKDSDIMLIDPELRMLSFSTGKRGCPGIMLGSTMTTILLARLIQGFSWGLPPNTKNIDLTELKHGLALAKPLIAHAMPRLDANVYLQLGD